MRLTALLRQASKPKIVCLDLDYTLWPWGVDRFELKPPYRLKNNQVVDAEGVKMTPFPEAEKCLQLIKDEGIQLAAVSRTYYYHGAYALLYLYGWSKYFDYAQAFPGSKTLHLTEIQEQSEGIPFNEMILFDDEQRNIDEVSKIGVTCIKLDPAKGLTLKVLEAGLNDFAKLSAGSSEKSRAKIGH